MILSFGPVNPSLEAASAGRCGYIVAQLGARMRYAIPRTLARAGLLERLYTDLYAGAAVRSLFKALPIPAALAPWAARQAPDIPANSVRSFPAFGLEYAARLRRARTEADRSAAFLWAGRRFCQLVRHRGFGRATAVYAFNDAALEILVAAREAGLHTVMEQTIAPLAVESTLLQAERDKFPGWEEGGAGDAVFEARCRRQREEWEAADVIVCGSEFVVEGIRQMGDPASRCVVVPYGVEGVAAPRTRQTAHDPLRVLTVGAVGLRKGAPCVMQAAQVLGKAAQFRMIGGVQLSPAGRAHMQAHVELTGAIPRGEVSGHYAWADVFLLPSVCEGSATATYEALAAGLPVICTPNTGSVVSDGVDGFIVPAGDPRAIAERLERCAEPGALAVLSTAALAKARDFSLEAYARRALAALAPEGIPA